MIKRFSLLLLLTTTLFSSCQQSAPRVTADVARTDIAPLATDGIHDRALLLAGLPVSEAFAAQPEIKALLNRPYYMQHRIKMDAFWKSVETMRISRIVPWRKQYIGSKVKNKTALYPLSGGDILNFSLIYPQAERYVMIAMEKPGDVPDPLALTDAQFKGGLLSLQQMLGNIAQTGYFFSRFMRQYMNPERYGIYGTMPTVSIFLVRLGHTLESVEKTCVDDAGRLTTKTDGACRLPGYRLRFRDGKTGIHKELIYISARIEDSLFSPDIPEGKFFRSLGKSSEGGRLSASFTKIQTGGAVCSRLRRCRYPGRFGLAVSLFRRERLEYRALRSLRRTAACLGHRVLSAARPGEGVSRKGRTPSF